MSSVHPRIVDESANLRALRPVATGKRQFDEHWLQELLFRHPDLLPIADIDPGFGELIPLAVELPVASGFVDILYASAEGSLCLVETKLWRNPEAHRTVLAQLLDYAKDLSRLSYEDLGKACISAAAARGDAVDGLDDLVKPAFAGRAFSSIDFEATLRQSLATGEFLLLIVGDRIRPEVALLSDVLGTAPNLEFTLALVEMNFYHLDGDEKWPVLAVPAIVGRSQEVTRAVVHIRYEEKRPEVVVYAAEVTETQAGKTNPETFLKSMASGLDEVFRPYLERWMSGPYTVYWGKTGFSVRYAPKGKLVTILQAFPTYMTLAREDWLAPWGDYQEAYRAYRVELNDIPEILRIFSRNGLLVYYDKLTPDQLRVLLEATDQLAAKLVESSRRRPA
jgi:hypothetical protein